MGNHISERRTKRGIVGIAAIAVAICFGTIAAPAASVTSGAIHVSAASGNGGEPWG
jgi:hypothetical protein